MILYFSGTGNSAYAAKRIGRALGDQTTDLFEKLRGHDYAPLHGDRPWVVVAPTYAWRLPRIVHQWLERTPLTGSREIYFVLTCGGGIGNAGKYLEDLCRAKGLTYRGCLAVVMPENYIALYAAPDRDQALEIIRRADDVIDRAARLIEGGQAFPRPAVTMRDRVSSGAVNDLFYPLFVHARRFYATDACVSCGRCAQVCPTDNIRLENGVPVWGGSCTHCMACISRCPTRAIEYGKHTKGLERYVCPDNLD